MARALCDHCCCCIGLRMGCLIIGYVEMISFTYTIIQIINVWKVLGGVIDFMKKLSTSKKPVEELEEIIRAIAVGTIIVWVLLLALKIFFCVIFLIGLHKNKRGHVGAYLLYTVVFLFLGIIFFFAFIIEFSIISRELSDHDAFMINVYFIAIVIIVVVSYVMAVYFWMVIRSQYHKMPINHPKKLRNPMELSPAIPNVRPEGPTLQISDESSRGTNMAIHPGQCTPPMEAESLNLRASTDVRSEGQTVQLNQESNRARYVADNSNQHGSVDVSPTSPALVVQPEEPGTPQNIKEGQSTNIADNPKLFSSLVDVTSNIGSDS